MIAARPILAASLLAARPARGRAVGARKDLPRYPRYLKPMPPSANPGRLVQVNNLFVRAEAARLRIRALRARQLAAGQAWRRTAIVTPAGVVTVAHEAV